MDSKCTRDVLVESYGVWVVRWNPNLHMGSTLDAPGRAGTDKSRREDGRFRARVRVEIFLRLTPTVFECVCVMCVALDR